MPMLSKIYLVSVGVADYPGNNMDLQKSANDARTIAQIYSSTKTSEVVLMLDKNATIDGVMDNVGKAYAKAKKDDTVIFFFSGHGAPGALCFYDGQLQYQRIFDAMKECEATNKFVIADACFSGKMRTGKERTRKVNPQNIVFFLSSRTNEVSKETAFSNGLFTLYLERGLRGGGPLDHQRAGRRHPDAARQLCRDSGRRGRPRDAGGRPGPQGPRAALPGQPAQQPVRRQEALCGSSGDGGPHPLLRDIRPRRRGRRQ